MNIMDANHEVLDSYSPYYFFSDEGRFLCLNCSESENVEAVENFSHDLACNECGEIIPFIDIS